MTQPTGVSEDARLREPDCVAEAATDAVGFYQRAIAREVLALRARVEALERAAPREMEQEKQAEVRRGWCTRCFYDVAQCTCRAGPAPAQPVRSPEPAEALADRLEKAWEFLCGAEANEDGDWFGDRKEIGRYHGAYWWRSKYRPLIAEVLAALRSHTEQEPVAWMVEWQSKYGDAVEGVLYEPGEWVPWLPFPRQDEAIAKAKSQARNVEYRVVPLYRRISEPTPSQGGNE